jgi:hypothetical protein
MSLLQMLRRRIGLGHTATAGSLSLRRERLRKVATVSDLWAVPVEDINRQNDQTGQRAQNGRGVVDGWVRVVADVVVQGRGVHRS